MKIATALGALALAFPAYAADLPSRKAAPAAYVSTAPTWTGFYAGLNAGYTWMNTPASVLAVGNGASLSGGEIPQWTPYPIGGAGVAVLNNGGFIGGGQVGYNIQINRFLIGAEGEFEGLAGGKKTSTFVTPGPIPLTANVAQIGRSWDWAGAATARAGFLVTPTLLIYGKGGAGFGHAAANVLDYSSTVIGMGAGTAGHVYGGWAYGGGIEWMALPHLSFKVEYLHFDLGKHQASVQGLSYGAPITAVTNYLVAAHLQQDVVKFGANLHFDWLTGNPAVDLQSANSAVLGGLGQ
jgi:outer membrane immunogenic protein